MTGQTAKSNPKANKIDEKELARLQGQDFWIQMTRLKLLMDLVFVCTYFYPVHYLPCSRSSCHAVAYNVFRLNRAKRPIQTITGLTAALLRFVCPARHPPRAAHDGAQHRKIIRPP